MTFYPKIMWDTNPSSEELANDILKIISELQLSIGKEKFNNSIWQLPSSMINSFSEMGLNNTYHDAFKDLYEEQVKLLLEFNNTQRAVVNIQKPSLGYRIGISTAFALYAYYFARQNPESKILIINKYDYQSSQMYRLMSDFCIGNCYRDKNSITLFNGTQITFRSEQYGIGYHGNTKNLIIIDDAEKFDKIEECLNSILPCLGPNGKFLAKKWSTFAYHGWHEIIL